MIEEALGLFDLENPKYKFIRHNENIVYQVIDGNKKYVLRIHQPVEGFSLKMYQKRVKPKVFIQGEVDILEALKDSEINFQRPVRNTKKKLVSFLDCGVAVTMLEWREGEPLKSLTNETSFQMGQTLAQVHKIFKEKKDKLISLKRYRYDKDLLTDIVTEINMMRAKEQLSNYYCNLLIETCATISDVIDTLDEEDFGLIHGDFERDNVIYSDKMIPIDFSLSGYGHPYLDIGIMLCDINESKLRKQAILGYEAESDSKLSVRYLEVFYVLSVILFIACQHDRIYDKAWFGRNMERWSCTLFLPVIEGRTFLHTI